MPQDKVIVVRYEDLIRKPKEELQKICSFLQISFEKEMLQFYRNKTTASQAAKSEFWKNLSQPLKKGNFGNFRKSLSKRELQIFEAVNRDILRILGYPLEFPENDDEVRFIQEIYFRSLNKIVGFVTRRKKGSASKRLPRIAVVRKIKEKQRAKPRKIFSDIHYAKELS